MTQEAQTPPPDQPFPGAHSQVSGAHTGEPRPRPIYLGRLPLELTERPSGQDWLIQLPVRAEDVHVTRRVVVRERVTIRRRLVPDVERVHTDILRERLRVEKQSG